MKYSKNFKTLTAAKKYAKDEEALYPYAGYMTRTTISADEQRAGWTVTTDRLGSCD